MENTLKRLALIFLLMSVREVGAETFTSAKVCANCHVAIYEGWKDSMHANAVNDPVFYSIFLEASRETGGKSDALCLSCHAPTSTVTRNYKLEDPLNAEGVSCDFCHSVQKVLPNHRLEVTPGRRKFGPLKDVSSPAHEAVYAPHYEDSGFCAGCHEFRNVLGAPILETYTEWQHSPQAKEGKNCQFCHMPEIKGMVVPRRVKPTKEVYINSHEAAGGHFMEQVKKAVTLKVASVTRDLEKVHAVVEIANVGSGHKVPTGLPSRRLVLRLKALSGGVPFYATERIFQKILVDGAGATISKDADLFLKAVRVKQDNRLEPGKTKAEHFDFLAPEGRPVEVEVEAYYLYQPRLIQETEMKVELGRGKVVLP